MFISPWDEHWTTSAIINQLERVRQSNCENSTTGDCSEWWINDMQNIWVQNVDLLFDLLVLLAMISIDIYDIKV